MFVETTVLSVWWLTISKLIQFQHLGLINSPIYRAVVTYCLGHGLPTEWVGVETPVGVDCLPEPVWLGVNTS